MHWLKKEWTFIKHNGLDVIIFFFITFFAILGILFQL